MTAPVSTIARMASTVLNGIDIRNPKLLGDGSPWYHYYAGYSADFVSDVLTAIIPKQPTAPPLIVDPWNGSGTTTLVSARAGCRVVGSDLNPALLTIAKGRHLSLDQHSSLAPLAADLVSHAADIENEVAEQDFEADALSAWFMPAATHHLRSLERAIRLTLVEASPSGVGEPLDTQKLSTLGAFYYCALFLVVRDLTKSFRASNPTWIRVAQYHDERVRVLRATIDQSFVEAVDLLSQRLVLGQGPQPGSVEFLQEPAQALKIDDPVDLVLSSPPYCTRIDYVKATLPELAVLGYDDDSLAELRQQMLGTPLTQRPEIEPDQQWGATALNFAGVVKKHTSRASGTYYYKYFTQYLDGLYRSVENLTSLLGSGGQVALVVQDSYYKETRFDLPRIVEEMGLSTGLEKSQRLDFPVTHSMAAIHPETRKYRSEFDATESLVLLKAG